MSAPRLSTQPSKNRISAVSTDVLDFGEVNQVLPQGNKIAHQNDVTEKSGVSFTYQRPKFGNDPGHIVKTNQGARMLKTGQSISLLWRAARQLGLRLSLKDADKASKEKKLLDNELKYLKFFVTDFIRLTGTDPTKHSAVVREFMLNNIPESLTPKSYEDKFKDLLFKALQKKLETPEGKAIAITLIDKEDREYTAEEVQQVVRFFVTDEEPLLKQVINLVAYQDLVNGAYSQHYNNACHKAVMQDDILLDDMRLLREHNEQPQTYLASRLIPNSQPFEALLLEPFKANQLADFAGDLQKWLAKCAADLETKLKDKQIVGIVAGILIRKQMGEGQDLGFDNMVSTEVINKLFISNVDVTGFRFLGGVNDVARDEAKKIPGRLGWLTTIQSNNADEIIQRLFDSSILSNRFIKDCPELKDFFKDDKNATDDLHNKVRPTILDILKTKIAPEAVIHEVKMVKEFLDKQNFNAVATSLRAAMQDTCDGLDPLLKPEPIYFERIVEHDCKFFGEIAQALGHAPVLIPKVPVVTSAIASPTHLFYHASASVETISTTVNASPSIQHR